MKLFFFCFLFFKFVAPFWPPPYKIDLQDAESFLISDMFDTDDAEDLSADDQEIIKEVDLKQIRVEPNPHRYYLIHDLAERKNRETEQKKKIKTETSNGKFEGENIYNDLEEPASAGFIDSNGNIVNDNQNVIYSNEMTKRMINRRANLPDKDYDYDRFKKDYEDNIAAEKKSGKVVKYIEVTEHEGLKDSIKNIMSFKKAKNCTKEEMKGIGSAAFRCFSNDIKKAKTKKQRISLAHKILRVVIIWIAVYIFIAVPCWCQRGWCCCCCRFKVCRPRETIDEIKQYLMDNPVGVLHVEGNPITYPPTVYERYAQDRLEQAVMKL